MELELWVMSDDARARVFSSRTRMTDACVCVCEVREKFPIDEREFSTAYMQIKSVVVVDRIVALTGIVIGEIAFQNPLEDG